MDRNRRIYFENSSGQQVILNAPEITRWMELGNMTGFTAPEVDIIRQKYANGITKILKRQLLPRTVSFTMLVTGTTTAERDAIFSDMVDKLMDVSGEGIGKLYIQKSDGMTVYLNCVYSSGLDVKEQYRKAHRFTLEFLAADPYFYRDLPLSKIALPTEGRLTLRDGVALGRHKLGENIGKTSGVINNTTNGNINPLIDAGSIRGSLVIVNETTGEELKLQNVKSPTDSRLIIDTREESKSIYFKLADGSEQQAGQYLDWNNLDFSFALIPGENVIRYEVGAGSYTEAVMFTMSERYLSV